MNSILTSDLHMRSLKRNFLVMKLVVGKIVIDLYCKSTDSHQYLYYDSCHTEHINRSIVFCQTFQLKKISSQNNRALRSEEKVKEKDGQHMNGNGVPLVVTYNPNFKNRRFNL